MVREIAFSIIILAGALLYGMGTLSRTIDRGDAQAIGAILMISGGLLIVAKLAGFSLNKLKAKFDNPRAKKFFEMQEKKLEEMRNGGGDDAGDGGM